MGTELFSFILSFFYLGAHMKCMELVYEGKLMNKANILNEVFLWQVDVKALFPEFVKWNHWDKCCYMLVFCLWCQKTCLI